MKRKDTLVQCTTTCSIRCKASIHANDGLRAVNEVAPGSKGGRIDNKAAMESAPIRSPRWIADRSSVAVGPVRRAPRADVAVAGHRARVRNPQRAAATRQRAAAAVQRRGGIRGSGAGRSGERSFPSPGMYGLRESRCSKHRSERDSSNQRFHGISPPNAFTMSGFAHLLSSSNWRGKLLRSIKSRVGVRGISHCTVKVHPRPLYEQLRQLTTHVEHAPYRES